MSGQSRRCTSLQEKLLIGALGKFGGSIAYPLFEQLDLEMQGYVGRGGFFCTPPPKWLPNVGFWRMKHMKKILSVVSVMLTTSLFLFTAGASFGQTLISGDITGRVTDGTGAAVANATLTLKSFSDGSVHVTKTDSAGEYRFGLLRPGAYSIHEEGSGMSADVKSVAVNVGQATSLSIVSKPSGNIEILDVDTNEPLLQTQDANISYTFSTQQIDNLPIPGGDITNLAFTAPGVFLSTGDNGGNFTAFGISADSNIFTVNGTDEMDPYNNLNNSGASNNTLGSNELSEAVVVLNGYTGQYGRLAGAQVNFTTRSGTNQFHGNALFEYNSSGLNANDWFNKQSQFLGGAKNAQPHAVNRQWAGRIGGPIWKNKLFAFFDDEGLRYALPGGGGINYLPTAGFQTAVLAHIATAQPTESAFYTNLFKVYTASPGFATTTPVIDAANDGGCGDLTGKATGVGVSTFGGGAGQTPCAGAFVSKVGNATNEQLYVIRVDANISANDQINFRYRHDFGLQATSSDPVNSVYSANSKQPEYDGQINETHTFNKNTVNSFSAGTLYYDAVFGPPNVGAGLALFPTTFSFGDGAPFATLGSTNYSYPSGRDVTQYQFIDDLSYTHGKNNFKFGFNFRRYDITAIANASGGAGTTNFGSYTDFYNGVISANPADTGAGSTTVKFSNVRTGHLAIYNLAAYLQDQIAVTKKFNLTASLRFDRVGNPACAGNCFVRFYSPFDQINHGASIPYNQSILSNQRNAFNSVEAVTPQPRIGFSWSPFGVGGKTVIRGGAGLFADIINPDALIRFITQAPNAVSFTVNPASPTGVAPGTNTGAPPYTYLVQPGLAGSSYGAAAASNAAFQNGFSSGQTLAQIQAAVSAAGSTFSAPSYTASTTNNLRNGKYTEFNLQVQQAITNHDVIDINYVGNFSVDVLQFNPTANAYAYCLTQAGRCPNGFPGLPAAQPDTRFLAVTTLTNNGHSNYNGVVTSYRHQGSRGLTMAVNYTFSHALDNTSNGGLIAYGGGAGGASDVLTQIDPTSADRLNYGSADYDARHDVSVNYSYSPVFALSNHMLKTALLGFSISGNLYAKSGTPYTVVRGSLASYFTNSTNGGSTLGAFLGGSLGACGNPRNQCLNINQYAANSSATRAQQANYGFGNQARNSYRGPMYFDTDMEFSKTTPITERVKFKIGANFFNILNHPNFTNPNANIAVPATFGVITGDLPPVSSPYGTFQGAGVSGRIIQVLGEIRF